MTETMQGFTKRGKKMPEKRTIKDRAADFGEIYTNFEVKDAAQQAERCAQCGVPFCQSACPLHNNIPDWLRLCSEGRLQEAYDVASATNTFPEICGRICPQDKLCEGSCVIEQSGHGTVTIGAVEKYITDSAFENGWVQPRMPAKEREQSIGIIGAGPAGLAAAEMLRSYGYSVCVYDRYDRVGGLLIYGIPNFKLDKSIVERREQLLREQGVVFKLEHDITDLTALKKQHDSVLIACGVYEPRRLDIPGADLNDSVQALDYLTTSNKHGLGDSIPNFESGTYNARGKDVIVIGGGDTAMDCLRTAIRQGAKSVKCLYRRDQHNMPGSVHEVVHAQEEGAEFLWFSAPAAFLSTANGPIHGIQISKMQLDNMDKNGRSTVKKLDGQDYNIDADIIIQALGFTPENIQKTMKSTDIKTTPWGTIEINGQTKMTHIDGVFAAGDIVRGASLVVWAIKDGRDAAHSIHTYLQSHHAQQPIAAE